MRKSNIKYSNYNLPFMKKILMLFVAVICMLLSGVAQSNKNLQGLVTAEKAFAQSSKETSTKEAFLKYLADDGILFRPTPLNGKKFWNGIEKGEDLLTWEPIFADISAAGDLGFTTGPFEQKGDRAGQQAAGGGTYISVWKKQSDGLWKVMADLGIGHPPVPGQAVFASSNIKTVTGTTSKADIMKVEQSFIDMQDKGLSVYNDVLSKEGKIFRPGAAPITTPDAIQAFVTATDKKFTYTPADALVADSGDLAYVYGTGTVAITRDGATRSLNTSYMRIWKKEQANAWKIVADIVAIAR
jgi:ketosteroid isomerase-like protein